MLTVIQIPLIKLFFSIELELSHAKNKTKCPVTQFFHDSTVPVLHFKAPKNNVMKVVSLPLEEWKEKVGVKKLTILNINSKPQESLRCYSAYFITRRELRKQTQRDPFKRLFINYRLGKGVRGFNTIFWRLFEILLFTDGWDGV